MFGSLVVVLPTVYTGGALHLRHGGKEIVHDPSSTFSNPPYNSVSWVAFYSDVEHEVAMVESGRRITLTYNLYFTDGALPTASNAGDITSNEFYQTFAKILADPTFLPDGGLLGFGLEYDYPINPNHTQLPGLGEVLKGKDALLFRVAQLLQLNPAFKVVYRTYSCRTYLCDRFVPNMDSEVEDLDYDITEYYGGKLIASQDDEDLDLEVHWIGTGSKNMEVKSYYVAYGNEASLGELYGHINLILTVANKDSRVKF